MNRTTQQYSSQTMVQEIIAAAANDKREQPWREYTQDEAVNASQGAAISSGTKPDEKVKVGGLADVQQLFFT